MVMPKRFVFMLAVFTSMLGSGYFWWMHEKQKNVYHTFQIKVDAFALELKESRLELYRSNAQINNDALSMDVMELKKSLSDLKESVQQIDGHALKHMLEEEATYIDAYIQAIQKYQSTHANIKNSVSYLKDIYYKELTSHSSMLKDESMVLIDRVLLGYFSDDIKVQAKDLKVLNKEKNPYILAHVKHILKQYAKIKNIKTQLSQTQKRGYKTLQVLSKKAQKVVQNSDDINKYLLVVLFSLTLLLLLFGVNTYIRLSRQNKHIIDLKKELEQFFEAFNNSAIVSKTDTKGRITYANDMFCKLSGFNKEELIGHNHRLIRHPDMPKELFSKLWDQITQGEHFHAIIKNRSKDGHPYYVDTHISPRFDVDGKIIEYIAVRYDVTELVHSRDEAIAAQKSKDEFFASMSHELRTPLNAIIGFSELLQKKVQGAQEKVHVDNIVHSSKYLLHLINDILDLAKIKSGKFHIVNESFVLKEELQRLFERFEAQAQSAKISLHYTCSCDTSLRLFSDWMRISQVYTNLLSNALKFTPEDGKVECYIAYKEGILEASFRDTGIGMDEETLKGIFSAYVQGKKNTDHKYGGTGLGLNICKDLVEIMGGKLEVLSKPGKGSTFSVLIPVEEAIKDEEDDTQEKELKETFKGHILVVEDNKTNQLLISMMLEECGLSCDIADNGEICLQRYEAGKYDLILMDENMPVMGGIETMKALHEQYEVMVPIVALTANAMQGDREKFLEAGMDDYLSKPIIESELKGILSRYLT